MSSLLASAASTFRAVREQLAPLPTTSRFLENGTLTPQEFVLAGDMLVDKCPTWQWAAGEKAKQRDYLPAEKQFLVTKNVPCRKRAREMEAEGVERMLYEENATARAGDDEAWVETHVGHQSAREIKDIDADDELAAQASKTVISAPEQEPNRPADDDIPDMDEEDLLAADAGVVEPEDPAALKPTFVGASADDNILKTRTYDLSITYDRYYQTPRVWLSGFSESGLPLTPTEIFDDISEDHARKTVTIESHPHLEGARCAGIHPCRHAETMKRLMDVMKSGKAEDPRVDLYLLVFLKFMSSVLPTIDYDFTM